MIQNEFVYARFRACLSDSKKSNALVDSRLARLTLGGNKLKQSLEAASREAREQGALRAFRWK